MDIASKVFKVSFAVWNMRIYALGSRSKPVIEYLVGAFGIDAKRIISDKIVGYKIENLELTTSMNEVLKEVSEILEFATSNKMRSFLYQEEHKVFVVRSSKQVVENMIEEEMLQVQVWSSHMKKLVHTDYSRFLQERDKAMYRLSKDRNRRPGSKAKRLPETELGSGPGQPPKHLDDSGEKKEEEALDDSDSTTT
ncbi:hypothetical protein ACFX2J_033953 [Malus domestica]